MPSISCKRLFSSDGVHFNKRISFDNGWIISIEDFDGSPEFQNISAPFFDTHINGGEQLYFTEENSLEAIEDIFNSSYKTGTFYVLPCLITSSLENILRGIEVMKTYLFQNPRSGVLGLHLEGPFLNPRKRGAHLAKYVRKPTDKEIIEILELGKDVIKIWTIAPEQFTDKQIAMILDAGITLSAGHSDATYQESSHAFSLGINLVTHLYNAMSGFQHRKPGLVGAALANKEIWAPIILDGKHCDFGAAKVAYNAKPDRLFIISDALFLGRKKRSFQWEEFDATLANDEYRNSDGNLAGSAISMGEAIRNGVNRVGIPIEIAIDMATLRPAKALGLDQKIGNLKEGFPAIFTFFDDDLSSFEVLNYV